MFDAGGHAGQCQRGHRAHCVNEVAARIDSQRAILLDSQIPPPTTGAGHQFLRQWPVENRIPRDFALAIRSTPHFYKRGHRFGVFANEAICLITQVTRANQCQVVALEGCGVAWRGVLEDTRLCEGHAIARTTISKATKAV